MTRPTLARLVYTDARGARRVANGTFRRLAARLMGLETDASLYLVDPDTGEADTSNPVGSVSWTPGKGWTRYVNPFLD